jgi:hypothetical protein
MTLVATALCADRAVVSSASVVPQQTGQSQTLVERLTAGFRRVVRTVRLYQTRCDTQRAMVSAAVPVCRPNWAHLTLSPFQFRLPPPSIQF